jgi:hypothetical protein
MTWDVEGPVQAEIFVVWLNRERLELTGPCGAAPWYVQLEPTQHPVEVVDRIVRNGLGSSPRLVHSTSWRSDRDAVILTFIVVADSADGMDSRRIDRTELARSQATAAPAEVEHDQVLEHALRHLAWLAADDPVVAQELSDEWKSVLSSYVPEPFRNLG